MIKKTWITGAALVLIAAMAFTACNKGGSRSGGGSAGSRVSFTPSSDFRYDLTEDGNGIKITGYTGNGGVVRIPATIEDIPVTEIGDYAFAGQNRSDYHPANNIIEIVLPDSVTVLGTYAFYWNDNLTKVTLPDGIKVLPLCLFARCENLTTVNLPASLEEIYLWAFQQCGELNNLIIPETISSVKFNDGFGGIDKDPNSITFFGCGKLPIATRQKIQGWGYTGSF